MPSFLFALALCTALVAFLKLSLPLYTYRLCCIFGPPHAVLAVLFAPTVLHFFDDIVGHIYIISLRLHSASHLVGFAQLSLL